MSRDQTLTVGQFELSLDFEPARVAVPPPPLPPPPSPTHLPDGRKACRKHSDQPATVQCSQCAATYCSDCVRDLRVAGGKRYRFCPNCGGACRPLRLAQRPKRASLLQRVRETLFGPPQF